MPDKETKFNIKGLFGGNKANDDPIRKLTRVELLELLIEQTRENEELIRKNEELTANLETAKQELAQCKEDLNRVASLEVILGRLEAITGYSADSPRPEEAGEAAEDDISEEWEVIREEIDSPSIAVHKEGIRRRWGLDN